MRPAMRRRKQQVDKSLRNRLLPAALCCTTGRPRASRPASAVGAGTAALCDDGIRAARAQELSRRCKNDRRAAGPRAGARRGSCPDMCDSEGAQIRSTIDICRLIRPVSGCSELATYLLRNPQALSTQLG